MDEEGKADGVVEARAEAAGAIEAETTTRACPLICPENVRIS
jgi:hypothetical protein